MEIHHQHHHDHPPHKEKMWAHYALEFFMLFLAVSAGFFAENIREHQVEKERGRQYIESFYADLKTDTALISAVINDEDLKITGLDNLRNCYDTISKNMNQSSCLLEVMKYSMTFKDYKITDRTLRQLENAGGFRLLNKEDADSILKYQTAYDAYANFQSTLLQHAQDNVRNTYNKVFDFNATSQIFKTQRFQDIRTFHEDYSGTLLYSSDKGLLNEYFNELFLYYRVNVAAHKRLSAIRQNQIRLLEFFRDKYHFE